MPIERILVPLDLTAPGEAKLPSAEEHARAFGASLLLLHVLPARPAAALAGRLPLRRDELDAGEVTPEEARARTYLDALGARLRSAGVTTRSLIRSGPVAATILDVAREEAADLIIIGSNTRRVLPQRLLRGNNRGPLSQSMLGGITGTVVADAPCPVLLVRPRLEAPSLPRTIRAFTDDATRAGLLAPRMLGQRTIDVARIIGSVGRAAELGENFRPPRTHRAEHQRYEQVRDAGTSGAGWPAIDVYKLGYGYYVLDGHRRVAAAKELGQPEIEANVTEFVPVDDDTAQQIFARRRTFERATGLMRIGAARPETYDRLAREIAAYGAAQGIADERDAAERWQHKVFGPLRRRIRALGLNRHFPGVRSADIFVHLADHRQAESARLGREVSWEDALESFAAAPKVNPEQR